jgi:putative thioredoxin
LDQTSVASLGVSDAEREAIERLNRDVIEPSMDALVLLDFRSERSAASKQLSPVLEKLAGEYAAKGVKLVKIDVDAEKLIAAQFRVQSIPSVYAFYHGQPVADLTAYRTETQLRTVIDQLLSQLKVASGTDAGPEIEPLIAMGEEILAEGDAARAVSVFAQIRELAPDNPEAAGGLVRALIAAGDLAEAEATLAELSPPTAKHAAVTRAQAALELASVPAADTTALEARLAANADDHEARFELAGARMGSGDRDGAADALLDLIGRDRAWNDGAARQRFLQLLEAQGLEDPWTRGQRRRLSAVLFT